MEREIVVNRVKCGYCGDILISRHRHDFVMCSCEKTFTDGGDDYLHIGGDNYENLSLYSNSDFSEIREYLSRGGRGKDGKQELKYVPLKDMSNDWLENVISYEEENRPNNKFLKYYYKEMDYRENNNIFIKD